MLEMHEAVKCFIKQDWFNKMNQEAMTGTNTDSDSKITAIADVMNFTDSDMNRKINLNEYVFLRKSASAWRSCVTGQMMNYKDLQCALRYNANGAAVTDGDARKVF